MDLPESLKAALGTAGGGADAATSAVDAAVSSAVASASKLTAVAAEAVNDRVEIGRAHLEAASWELRSAEDKLFKAPSRALASAIDRAPYATAAAGAALALLAVPGTRRILWHASFGRMQSEEALVRAATRSAETLKAASEGTSSELARLRDAAVAAEEEMTRGRGKLRQAAADLKRLVRDRPRQNTRTVQNFSIVAPSPTRRKSLTSNLPGAFAFTQQASRTSKDERSVSSTLLELRSLPSKRALELRTDIAKTKNEMAKTSSAIDAALRRVFKAGVDI
ncbi:predicted protein [Micromonas commoda]|uniref:Uncharacterized protein n=1 Tax=Micromonas commoda (strain RCC299 / NOUM17 / CCMP2709) TaxID=296587 RepID=C1ECU3_MICCC|nr:predicted protein [Micromonas commoda]ACO65640.1 predicted protein [Micromonas commoda]|eukprot:XP_002504382.1 predicted protein [Micromonas commoda]